MASTHIVVSQRETGWQFSYHGEVTAPFTSREAAVAAAIEAAQATGQAGVEVLVQNPDLRTETVWPQRR